jgi:hypothetical protein
LEELLFTRSEGVELEDLDAAAVVVGNPKFVPAVAVKISESQGANSATFFLDSVPLVDELSGVSRS